MTAEARGGGQPLLAAPDGHRLRDDGGHRAVLVHHHRQRRCLARAGRAASIQVSWVLTSYVVAAVMTAPVGWLANRFGIKTLLLTCVTGFRSPLCCTVSPRTSRRWCCSACCRARAARRWCRWRSR